MSDNFADLDIFLRGGVISVLLICTVLFLLKPNNRRKSSSVAALCLGLCAYLLVSSPNLPFDEGWVVFWLVLAAGTVPALVYWAAMELFLDYVVFSWWQLAVCGAIVMGAWLMPFLPGLATLRGGLIMLLLAHLLYVIATSAPNDLVETRRKFRLWFLVIMVILGVTITTIEIFEIDGDLPVQIFALHSATFLVLSGAFLLWAAQIAPDLWVERSIISTKQSPHSPAEIALVSRVQKAMEEGAWREEGLTISQLAAQLGSQEHRLRRAINQVLGFRNFASFVNGYRISAAKDVLSDPEKAEITILSIAYEVGFASLGPFNRAFRDITNLTPTEFRQLKISIELE